MRLAGIPSAGASLGHQREREPRCTLLVRRLTIDRARGAELGRLGEGDGGRWLSKTSVIASTSWPASTGLINKRVGQHLTRKRRE